MNKRASCKINNFKYPASDQISGRTSTICRSMACTLLMRKACSPEEEAKWMSFFPEKQCAYCGKPASHLDHLYPLIIDRKPTGYGTEPANLVPCCTECNQPKGNMNWEDYMRSSLCKHVGNESFDNLDAAIEHRINVLREFEKSMGIKKIEMSEDAIKTWNTILQKFDRALADAQDDLLELKKIIYKDI